MQSPALGANQSQQTAISPRLQYAVRLLQMSSDDFVQTLGATAQRNPFLEIDDPADDEQAVAANDVDDAAYDTPDDATYDDGDTAAWSDLGGRGAGSSSTARDDGDADWMDTVAAQASLAGHLHGQIDVLKLSPRERVLAKAIVESLDDDGYLRTALEDLFAHADLSPAPAAAELQAALRCVQSLEPAGVAARSVQEALLLQLPAVACPQERELVRRIVSDHLDRLAARDTVGLAKRLQRPADMIERACARIRRFDPRPGWRFSASTTQYVTPDVIVKQRRGVWTTTLNPVVLPKLRMNRVLEELYRRQGRAPHAEMSAHLQEARWTLRNVEQRFATILGVSQAIVERQRQFLELGAMAMKPLSLREIADKVGVHESTVSRVTNNKYMSTPNGTFELKYFFSRSMTTASGGACSGTALRGLIKTMIETERPGDRLSDAELARRLSRQGLVVARRTVTKYRQALHFGAADQRARGG